MRRMRSFGQRGFIMNNHPADKFITQLSTTLRDFKDQASESKELGDLVDMSAHMIAALGALRSYQVRAETSSQGAMK